VTAQKGSGAAEACSAQFDVLLVPKVDE